MTIKEIALAVGAPERTVRRWAENVAAKMATVADKMAASSPRYPADYNLDETVAIISEGLGENAGHIFRMNAEDVKETKAKAKPVISGALVNALVKAEQKQLLSRSQIWQLLGLNPEDGATPAKTAKTPLLPISPNGNAVTPEVAKGAQDLMSAIPAKAARELYGHAKGIAEKEIARQTQDKLNYKLPLGGRK